MSVVHRGIAMQLDGVGDLQYSEVGGNIFIDQLPEDADRGIAVNASSGLGYESDSGSKLPYDAFYIHIIVRGGTNPDWALDTWNAIYSALHGLSYVTLPDGTQLLYAIVTTASPVRIGADGNGRMRYSMNLRGETVRA